MGVFYMPVKVYTQEEAVGKNASMLASFGRKALLVTGRNSARANGSLEDVCKALDRDMNPITVEGTELLARCICHELDHLDGVLYKDLAIDGLHRVDLPQETDEETEES